MEDDLDAELSQNVRDAILKVGGVPAMSESTGIPKKTLEKYLAKRSVPSLTNAAKIARAAKVSVDSLTARRGEEIYKLAPADIAKFASRVIRDIHLSLLKVYHDENVRLPPEAVADEVQRLFNVVLLKLDNMGDLYEAEALIPWLERRIRSELREAKASPGTGKRSAS